MTRYARGKGSKASNERVAEEATPWWQLKNTILDKTNNSTDPLGTTINWKDEISKEKKIKANIYSVWCDFGEENTASNSGLLSKSKGDRKEQDSDEPKLLKQNNLLDQKVVENRLFEGEGNTSRGPKAEENMWKSELHIGSNFRKENRDKRKNAYRSLTWKESKKFNGKDHKRRKIDQGDMKFEINGQEVFVTRFDGFYIRIEDAKRIKDLEKKLVKKGVARSEIKAVIKKERRNAEKSLARQKKKVCFHCRKGGHNLSECPKLGSEVSGSGICYKCGSTEHSHIDCRVSTSYKFAICFICKEEGHISRECPDNPRGLYPKGGGCKICGDVTHFRRDCPRENKEKLSLGFISEDIEVMSEIEDSSQIAQVRRKNRVIKFQ